MAAPQNAIRGAGTPLCPPHRELTPIHPPSDCALVNAPQTFIRGGCTLTGAPQHPPGTAPRCAPPGTSGAHPNPASAAGASSRLGRAGSCPERHGLAEPARPVPPPSPSVSGQAGAGGEWGPMGTRWVAAGAGPWERGAAASPRGCSWCQPPVPAPGATAVPCPAELSASDESSLSDAVLLEEGKGPLVGGTTEPCPVPSPSTPTLFLSRRGDAAARTRHPAGVPVSVPVLVPLPTAPFSPRGVL